MKILVTAARAPVALEWARILRRSGHEVLLCDSLRFPLGRFAPQWARFVAVPAPRLDFSGYQKAMTPLIEAADMVIPTCEDIFHLARLPLADAARAKCLMPPNPLLFGLHHKLEVFSLMPKDTAIAFPETRLVTDPAEVVPDAARRRTVLKPVFSRFGRSVIRGAGPEHRRTLPASPGYPWVQQRFVEGEPLCNYALCARGELIAHAAYRPRYLLNGAAAAYIEPIEDQRMERFVRAFARLRGYHGQAAFDFIDDGERLWLLECNPRATSGLHLLRHRLRCAEDGRFFPTEGPVAPAYRVGVSLPLLFGPQALREGRFGRLLRDYRAAEDVLSGLPFRASLLALGEMCHRALRHQKPLTTAGTFDIEYDGEDRV